MVESFGLEGSPRDVEVTSGHYASFLFDVFLCGIA